METYVYTKLELEQLLKSIIILYDTREQVNGHIIDYFNKQNISYKKQKLDYGDYSFMLPQNKELGIIKDISFEHRIVIERKANLEELSNNLTHKRIEFENELIRASKAKKLLLIEDASYQDIIEHKYCTKYEVKSFIAALKTYENRYNLNINYISRVCSGNFIYYTCYYFLREYLKS
jgi:hypothetical protein